MYGQNTHSVCTRDAYQMMDSCIKMCELNYNISFFEVTGRSFSFVYFFFFIKRSIYKKKDLFIQEMHSGG